MLVKVEPGTGRHEGMRRNAQQDKVSYPTLISVIGWTRMEF